MMTALPCWIVGCVFVSALGAGTVSVTVCLSAVTATVSVVGSGCVVAVTTMSDVGGCDVGLGCGLGAGVNGLNSPPIAANILVMMVMICLMIMQLTLAYC